MARLLSNELAFHPTRAQTRARPDVLALSQTRVEDRSIVGPGTCFGLIAIGAVVGLPTVAHGMAYNFSIDWRAPDYFFRGLQFNYWASVLVSLGWVGAVMLVCRCGAPRVTSRLAAVGRTAFANDILQIVICSTLFYGHGFGLFGMLDRLTQAAIVRVVWAFQLTVSPLWMRRFHFGPLEWLWRSLVYLKMQPFE